MPTSVNRGDGIRRRRPRSKSSRATPSSSSSSPSSSPSFANNGSPPPGSTAEPVQAQPPGSFKRRLLLVLLQGAIHLGCIALYLIPILAPNEHASPTLDESHVMNGEVQRDIHDPNATLTEIFSNDYWGRPMNSPSSHKSWRPLTILSFRYLKGPYTDLSTSMLQQLTVHRTLNAIFHAAAGDVVGRLATQLFAADQGNAETLDPLWLQLATKILFCLHPTHVEVTANAANRNHILAVFLAVVLCFPGNDGAKGIPHRTTTPMWLFLVALVSGYLVSETFIFIVPAVMVTMTVVAFGPYQKNASKGLRAFVLDYLRAMLSIAPRLVFLALSAVSYYGGRWYFDTLDIPTGLIRPAESPYYTFTGMKRVRNYLYILTVHLGKQWGSFFPKTFGGDPIGFSHEYGYDCIPEIKTWGDERLVFGVGFHLVFAMGLSVLLVARNPRQFFGLVAIHWSWTLITLFPITGILKVGTFVSDRIVVPSTVAIALWSGRVVQKHLTQWVWKKDSLFGSFRPLQFVFVLWWIAASYTTVHSRALQWMDSISLMNSALVTCPRFAKVHMEVSKIHSGLFPDLLDLKTARDHLDTAREIDPDLCDLHQQYIFLALREYNNLEIEKELPGAMLCPFTASWAEQLWLQYWEQQLASAPQGTPQYAAIASRYQAAFGIIQEGIEEQQRAEQEAQENER